MWYTDVHYQHLGTCNLQSPPKVEVFNFQWLRKYTVLSGRVLKTE